MKYYPVGDFNTDFCHCFLAHHSDCTHFSPSFSFSKACCDTSRCKYLYSRKKHFSFPPKIVFNQTPAFLLKVCVALLCLTLYLTECVGGRIEIKSMRAE